MDRPMTDDTLAYLPNFTSRKGNAAHDRAFGDLPDSLAAWMDRYLALAVTGVRSDTVARKIALHLARFVAFFREAYGHDRISACLRRDVQTWQTALRDQGLAPATVNNHMASLSAFATWVHAQAPRLFPLDDPTKGIGDLGLLPLEPRALRPQQVRTLKNLCDRLDRFHRLRGQRWTGRDGDAPARTPGTSSPCSATAAPSACATWNSPIRRKRVGSLRRCLWRRISPMGTASP